MRLMEQSSHRQVVALNMDRTHIIVWEREQEKCGIKRRKQTVRKEKQKQKFIQEYKAEIKHWREYGYTERQKSSFIDQNRVRQ